MHVTHILCQNWQKNMTTSQIQLGDSWVIVGKLQQYLWGMSISYETHIYDRVSMEYISIMYMGKFI